MDRRDFGKVLGSAVAGMVAGTKIVGGGMDLFARADKAAKHVCKGMNSCKGQGGCKSSDNGCAGKNSCKGKGGCATVARHGCRGMNDCKGQGGCKSGDKGCAGKNSCKGKGGCSVPIEAKKARYDSGSGMVMA